MAQDIQNLKQIVAKLRDPNGGCPWDLKQNYDTMIPCLIEESYEVIEAIRQKNTVDLREELGDLLMQVVFLSQLASEENKFTLEDVINDICNKLVYRHPHVFGDKSASNEQEALQNWNMMKAQEAKNQAHTSILDNVPFSFPALLRAEKLQKKCSKVGFDWNELLPVIEKVEEELQEVKQELNKKAPSQEKIEEEVGDLFFATVNLSRHLKVQAEESLRKANHKFERRFRALETKLQIQNKSFEDTTLAEMDMLWDEVKKQESQE
ncbi:nucleoside triphosphate pyrophosphohydrolase [Mannheimia massilioguelmaensis]|uniref:nucleoside triphosphate pyrophosphohydrolase n=1 Tax=Mannheimia massilioguelmaensis TaxID=1604354 RepID=UPI0005C94B05|nr:nucleoside triphosphate pyrophosphohydrolase [Mannheimia massilioguelmaensis]